MCFFITVVASEAGVQRLHERLPRDLHLAPLRNGDALWTLTSGGCSCDLFRGQPRASRERKLARKGWSNAKILRALQQANDSAHAKRKGFTGLREDVRALLTGAAPVGFYIHAYSGDVDDDGFEPGGAIAITSSELAAVAVDRLYTLGP